MQHFFSFIKFLQILTTVYAGDEGEQQNSTMERTSPAVYSEQKQTGINKFPNYCLSPPRKEEEGLTTDAVNILYVKVHY